MQTSYHFSLNFVNIIILVYMMVDAPKHGKNPILWGVLGFLFGPIALTIYLFKTWRKGWGYVWLAISILTISATVGLTFFVVHRILHLL